MSTQAKTAVVTGANSGIGLALTKKLLAEGYRVIGTARSGQIDGLSDARLTVIPLDLTAADSTAQAVARIGQLTQDVDLLVNNAGIAPDVLSVAPPERTAFRETFATNVDGTVFFTEPIGALLTNQPGLVCAGPNWFAPFPTPCAHSQTKKPLKSRPASAWRGFNFC